MAQKHKSINTVLPLLPKRSFSLTGKPCEPITLIILGKRRKVMQDFIRHGWFPAVSINPLSALHAFWATVLNRSYITGPISPQFVNKKHYHVAFQRPTHSNTFRRRHHLRLWKTPHTVNGKRVWVGMLSYDRGTGFVKHSLFPTHHICSTLNSEENFLARTLNLLQPAFVTVSEPEIGVISNGDPYTWDGKALVVDIERSDEN